MAEQTVSSAVLGGEISGAYERLAPLVEQLQVRVEEVARKAGELFDEASSGPASWEFAERWPWIWLADSHYAPEVKAGNIVGDGIYFQLGVDDYLLPFEVLDNFDAVLADGKAMLTGLSLQLEAERAAERDEERKVLLARLAELDAQEAGV